MADETELKRLYWHSRRGMLELDVLLVPFVQEVYATLDADDQARYRKLLECEDQDMFGWFMQREEPEDPDLKRMVKMILDKFSRKTIHPIAGVPGGFSKPMLEEDRVESIRPFPRQPRRAGAMAQPGSALTATTRSATPTKPSPRCAEARSYPVPWCGFSVPQAPARSRPG